MTHQPDIEPHAYVRRSGTNYCARRDCGAPAFADIHDAPRYCTDPAHTSTTITEGDPARCGECGLLLYNDIGPAADLRRPDPTPPPDVFDATTPPGIQQLPAVTTSMTPAQFKDWLAADGTLFMVILPANRTFIIKVPAAHHEFFVAMMQQVRFALGPEVQAVRMNVVSGEPPAADGTASEAPSWAQPAPGERLPEQMEREAQYDNSAPADAAHTLTVERLDTPLGSHIGECSCGHWRFEAIHREDVERRHAAHVALQDT